MDEVEFSLFFEELLEKGAVVDTGQKDEFGETIFKFNLEVLKVVRPDMHSIMMDELSEDLLDLYKLGLIDIDYDENLEVAYKINEAGIEYAKTGVLPEPRTLD
jgi:hypothetical protein